MHLLLGAKLVTPVLSPQPIPGKWWGGLLQLRRATLSGGPFIIPAPSPQAGFLYWLAEPHHCSGSRNLTQRGCSAPGKSRHTTKKLSTTKKLLHPAPFLGWYHEYAVAKQLGGDFTNQTDLVLILSHTWCYLYHCGCYPHPWASSMCYDSNNAT